MISPPAIPIFGGQGMMSLSDTKKIISLATSPSGVVLLDACHTAFHDELLSLTPAERRNVDICASDFTKKHSILVPDHQRYYDSPTVSGASLVLLQSLAYMVYAEAGGADGTQVSFAHRLHSYANGHTGVLGFSSGIISACVVATSPSIPSFISNALQAYRLALWIGIRSQLYRKDILDSFAPRRSGKARSWSSMLRGLSPHFARESLSSFNKPHGMNPITITAVMSDDCITVSGEPEYLVAFAATLPDRVLTYQTRINALYHRQDLRVVRDAVLADVVSRNIRFPLSSELIAPIRSTFTGDLIFKNAPHTLLEQVVDMILIHPVNWDAVVEKSAAHLPSGICIKLLNIGLGSTMIKLLERSFSQDKNSCQIVDFADGIKAPRFKVKQEPIAIIGMAVKMPGAPSVTELWEVLESGQNTVSTIPNDRFSLDDYKNMNMPGRSLKVSTGNFVDDIGQFDNKFFNISPREARSMDPQQRILLQVGYEALEDAGYVPNSSPTFNPDKLGCFIGAATHDYVHNLRNEIDVYYSTGTLAAFLSGRLSYCLGLSGPSMVVDTACSSSMVAIHQAVRALMNRDCDAALAGGVNVISSPDMFIGLDKGHFLTASGQCKSFDSQADGYSRAEGCGIFVLKRLADAVAENDQILGVIRGVEVNQSGNARSITHPHIPTQEALFRQLLSSSDIDFNSVSLVEAHGTGTQAGDISEMESIRRVLAVDRMPDNPLHVTSIKANTGHLEAASGCASLTKVLLMFRHQIIPRQISLQTLNPRIASLDSSQIIISRENVSWSSVNQRTPRIAIVNNFGAAGSNAALLVEEHVQVGSNLLPSDGISYVFGLSAKDETSLKTLRTNFIEWLRTPTGLNISLQDIAYSATARRQLYRYRLAVGAATKDELIKNLSASTIFDATSAPSVIFVFSGQGSHYHGMGRALYQSSPIFRHHIDECDEILTSSGFSGVLPMITGHEGNLSLPSDGPEEQQSAILSLEYALAKLWMSWDVQPTAVVGHSLGEYAALVIAGVLSLKDALFMVATRARLMIKNCPQLSTGMAAISLDPQRLQTFLDENQYNDLSISCFNSPQNCTVSGPLLSLRTFIRHIEKETRFKVTQLSVPYGYHSPSMAPITDDLVCVAGKLRTSPTRVPFISTVLNQVVMPGDPIFPPKDYLVRHCAEPVRFAGAIESYLASSIFTKRAAWLEIGPHTTTLSMLKSFPTLCTAEVLVGSLSKGKNSWTSLSKALASFYNASCVINWRSVFSEIGSFNCVSLPSYPFTPQNFWVHFPKDDVLKPITSPRTNFSLIQKVTQLPDSGTCVAAFETSADHLRRYIEGHKVGEVPLCPASVYLEMVCAAVRVASEHLLQFSEGDNIVLRQINFPKPLTYSNNLGNQSGVTLSVAVDPLKGSFAVKSGANDSAKVLNASGVYDIIAVHKTEGELNPSLPSILSSIDRILNPECGLPEVFSTRTTYQVIFPRVVEYSKEFHTLQTLTLLSDGMEGVGVMKLGSTCEAGNFVVHPIFLDTFLHIAGFLANLHGNLNDAFICNEIGSMYILPSHFSDTTATFTIYCKIHALPQQRCMLGDTYVLSMGTTQCLVAHIKGIRFQRVRLTGLKACLSAALRAEAPSNSSQWEATHNLLPSKEMICRLVAKACEMHPDDIPLDEDLDRLGMDSLMRLELSNELSNTFPTYDCRTQELSTCNTVADLINIITSQATTSPSEYFGCRDSPHTPINRFTGFFSPSGTLVQHTETNSPVKRIFANILDMDEDAIKDDSELASLGLDSLASIEALQTLRHEYNLEVPGDLINNSRTIRDVEHQMIELRPSFFPFMSPRKSLSLQMPFTKTFNAISVDKPLSLLQNVSSNLAPLVLIHDGSGLVISYERLPTLNRRVWAISNPRFRTSETWPSVVEMAQAYANIIFDEIEGPVILGGWSFGGVVAFDIARQLRARHVKVKGVILIDSPDPLAHVPLSRSLIDRVLGGENLDAASRKLCKTQFAMNAQLLSNYSPPEISKHDCPPLVFLRSTEPYNTPGIEDSPSWLSNRTDPNHITRGWNIISKGQLIKTLDIPGNHFEPFGPRNIGVVSRRIDEACILLDKM
ncbi:ketoacyl-synt-domain-containing protein [Pholiota conissans]|uniref:Ketoacyl-synt-domain-containing protein n=1 Tax=Pholiota conissans TaxID=109636 RepID=A0A9P5ZBN5_9AGAR|nr:ketoacyl-synt-domain-containing protein [Pholiota conissans]